MMANEAASIARRRLSKVWKPDGALPGTEWALSVPYEGNTLPSDIYRELLAAKFDALIREDPKAARVAMEQSCESAQNFWSIAQEYPVREWSVQLVMCDQLQHFLNPLTGTGRVVAVRRKQSFGEILELLSAR